MARHDLGSHQMNAFQENAGHSPSTSTYHGHTSSEVLDHCQESSMNHYEVVSSNRREYAVCSLEALDLDRCRVSSNRQENAGRSLEVLDHCKVSLNH
jgi:hypothetical protein